MSQIQRTILIIDDDSVDRALYQRYLRRDKDHSYQFLEASLGEAGLKLWQQQRPDVVLLDYRLPDLDGLTFLTRLQQQCEQISLPVIMVTGQGSEEIAVQAIKIGAQDYLVKEQITPESLQLAVNGAISTVQLRTQLQQRIDLERLSAQITQQIRQSLDLNDILDATVIGVRQFLQTDRVVILRLDAGSRSTVVAESVGESWQSLLSMQFEDICMDHSTHDLSHQSKGVAKANIYDGSVEPCYVELLSQFQIQANLVVAILYEDKRWGLLIAHHCVAPRQWQPLEIDLLQQLGAQVSIAVRQAELYQQAQQELAERKQAEAELRVSEERLQLSLDGSGSGIWNWTIATGDIYISSGWLEMLDYRPGELTGHLSTWVQLIHPDDKPWVIDRLNAHLENDTIPYRFEYRLRTRSGHWKWIANYGKIVVRDEQGKPLIMAGVHQDISARKQAEAAQKASEEQFRTLADNMSQFAWMTDASGWTTWYNRRWFEYTGTTLEEMQGWGWQQVLHPAHVDRVVKYFRHCIETGTLWEDTFPLRGQDGTYRWFLSRAIPIRNEAGQMIRWFGTNTDIDDFKQAEASLQQSEERLRLVLESSRQGMWYWDLEKDILTWTTQCKALFGLAPDAEMSYEVFLNALYPDDRLRTNEAVTAAIYDHVDYDIEYRSLWPDGTVRWIAAKGHCAYNALGQPIRLMGVAIDITQRKQTEEALRQSEERYRCLAELIPQLVWTADPEGLLLDVNQRWTKFTGLSLEQVQIHGWEVIIHPDDLPILSQQWAVAVHTGAPYQAEGRMRQSDGAFRWHLHQAIPQKNEQGQVLKWFGTATNIEAQKQLEGERDRLLQLEKNARTEAERVNRVKDEFLAILSHELRSPLNPILGWTKLLQSRKFDPTRTAEALATIERNAKLQTQLIDDLLDVAKILRGKLSLNVAPVNLAIVIEQAIETVKTAAVAKSILISPKLLPTGTVAGDAARFQQIVWNLLSNAIKFTPSGGMVTIQLEPIGDQAQITVTDNGKGINPTFLPYLFESFRQEDVSITRQHGGLGLGLAIVRYLVEAHGGTVSAYSRGEGLGATFAVQLPLLSTEPGISPVDGIVIEECDLVGVRVLTIDDDPDARELLTVLLEEYGAEVMTVTSSSDFLAAIPSFQPHVLISDVGMPTVDGYTLMQKVRALPPEQGGTIPAIALTAYVREIDQQKALEAGFQEHLAKPLEPDLLMQTIARLVVDSEGANDRGISTANE
ncbi:MAG: PAS domain-containing protein [Scytolyngbya sp. HA4215-MV1]|jgi:PAS domain S-box-containing protein|nr:PAS domain-containing protein [Scytolyngbya sp. HA4215-MV1]